jgi:hypothetical protein
LSFKPQWWIEIASWDIDPHHSPKVKIVLSPSPTNS